MDNRKDYYTRHRDHLAVQITMLKHRNRGFILGEIITFIAFIAFVAAYTAVDGGMWTLFVAAFMLLLYMAIRRFDVVNSRRIEWLEALHGVYERELRYLSGDYKCFDDGARYADPSHPFTFDMDVFGRESLYNRVCRTLTTGGSDCLARSLSGDPFDGKPISRQLIDERREAIDELAAMPGWRVRFLASGAAGRIDTDAIVASLQSVRAMNMSRAALSVPVIALATLSMAGFYASILLSVFDLLPSSVPSLWGVLQFFTVLMLCSGPLRKISREVNSLHDRMKHYVNIIRHADNLRNGEQSSDGNRSSSLQSAELQRLVGRLDGAMDSFHETEQILKSLDRRGNILGLIIFDMFLLSDYFLLRRFLKWQGKYLDSVGPWVDTVSRIDALVSMATFRYNEPEAGSAVIADGDEVVYEARGLYHPFLGRKAVKNDFSIVNGNYYIVTGANMAGKSTFLRSLGINYILAMNGMPVFADSLRVSVFALFTSMRTTDDLTRGISYFNAELLRLRQLIDFCPEHKNTLIILDEILKGTNSADKLNGSRLFLEYISGRNVTGVIATHDLELSRMSDEHAGRFHNYCFEIELGTDVTYSYKITPGVARNQNATFLLKELLAGKKF
ncbi:MutS-related protein [Prevotella sp. HCN-7019]|uniref:MutS-related protein n=1 Tax=Prevotella sp. HCN-7019 TaxID=3134668 RepID=UPI0030C38ACD